MPRTISLWLVLVSVAAASAAVDAARPYYGGTLRIESQGVVRVLDPAVPVDPADAAPRDLVLPLVFETLVGIAPAGGIGPALATSWDSDAQGARWRFVLRSGVRLHDGSTLELAQVAAALRQRYPDWLIAVDGTSLDIHTGAARADLLWDLADIRNAIAVRGPSGGIVGTGPFRVERLDGVHLSLAAHDGYWGSRPFLDAVRIEFGRTLSSQLTSLETARADMIAVRPTDVRRLTQQQLRVVASRPLEGFALVFEPHRGAAADMALRRTVSAAIDRAAVVRVLLQGYGEPATSLLPTWLSGYAPFVLAEGGARLSRAAVSALPVERRTLVLRIPAGDSVAQAMADRIAVDARDAGLTVTVQAPTGLAPRADMRLIRVPLSVTTPDRGLAGVMGTLGPRTLASATREAAPAPGSSLDAVARVERSLLEQHVIVPIVHVPALYAVRERVDWLEGPVVLPSGRWNLEDVWVEPDRVADRP
jgi:peptide/nickel transport system substrate-binding protein